MHLRILLSLMGALGINRRGLTTTKRGLQPNKTLGSRAPHIANKKSSRDPHIANKIKEEVAKLREIINRIKIFTMVAQDMILIHLGLRKHFGLLIRLGLTILLQDYSISESSLRG